MTFSPPRYRFNVTEYYQMLEVGIFTEDDRVELLDGDVIEMPSVSPRHAATDSRCIHVFYSTLQDEVLVSSHNPLRIDAYNEPLPDVMLLQPKEDYYRSGHPGPDDVFLLVEVTDTSLAIDRQVKLPLYARSGIAEYWIIDLEAENLLVYRDPTPDGYRLSLTLHRGDHMALLAFPDGEIAVTDILG